MAWHAAAALGTDQGGEVFPVLSNLVAPTCAIARRGLLKRAASTNAWPGFPTLMGP
jgi:hypothetical protein